MGILSYYCVLIECITIFLIKLDGFLENSWRFDSILVFDGVYLSLDRKDLGHPANILRIIGEAP